MEETKNVQSNLNEYATFALFSKAQKNDGEFVTIFEDIFTIKKKDFTDYMFRLVNDFQSPYFTNFKNIFVSELCTIDGDTAFVHTRTVPEIIGTLEQFINTNMRRYQQTIAVLNYTPSGYYRKSQEERQEIQKKIDDTILEYVERYVAPDFSQKIDEQQRIAIKDILSSGVNSSSEKLN